MSSVNCLRRRERRYDGVDQFWIDVATQQSSQWPLSKWVDYIASRQHPPTDEAGPSMKTHNIISLEISGTELAKKVRPPRIVSEIDWVDNFWNFGPGGKSAAVSAAEGKSAKGEKPNGVNGVKAETPEIEVDSGPAKGNKGKAPASWPKVQLYCLMGAQGSWTVSWLQELVARGLTPPRIGMSTLPPVPSITPFTPGQRSVLLGWHAMSLSHMNRLSSSSVRPSKTWQLMQNVSRLECPN